MATMICPVCEYLYRIVPGEPVEESESEAVDQSGGDPEQEESSDPTESADLSDQSDVVDIPHYQCRNCGNHEPIPAQTEIYSRSYRGEKTFEDYQMDFDDPTLARTRQYHCPKRSCPTHKDLLIKEAIITKTAEGQVVYLCTACRSDWHPIFQ